jgi:hypothetical protein
MVSSRPYLPRYRTLLVDAHAGVATITLDRPDRRNAVGDGMRDELAEAYTRSDGAENVRRSMATRRPGRTGQATSTPAARSASTASAVVVGDTPAVRSISTRVLKPAAAASAAVAFTQ